MMTRKKSLVTVFFLMLFVLPLLSACYTPAGRTAGEVIDDAAITTQVKAKLFDADELNGFAISVKTFEGIVTLTGAVNTSGQKARAETVARSVPEVRGVNNLLVYKQ